VVTNHDLVLADLKLRDDGDSPLLPFERYAVIFDEAHQLPEKARESASACVSQQDTALLQEVLPVILTGVDARPWLLACLSSEGISSSQLLPGPLQAPMANLFAACAALGVASDDCVVFGRTAPDDLIHVTTQAAEAVYPLLAALLVLSTYLRKQLSKENSELTPAAKAGLLHLATLTSKAVSAARRLLKGLFGFCSSEPHARWLANDSASGAGFLLHSGPVDGGEVLPDLLWNQPFPVVLISATLQTLGSFDSFTKQAAVPPEAVYLKVESTFNYQDSNIDLYALACQPGEPGFTQELIAVLTSILNPDEGTLVLFTSVDRMRKVAAGLPPHLASRILMQKTKPVKALVEAHRAALDKGHGSILFGTDTFAEGIDLPGSYCTHVVVTQIPFPQFGSPLEEVRRMDLGSKHFAHSLLPAAARKLAQAIGRLLRRESDKGRVSILDVRMRRKSYGARLLRSLPPFVINRI
jgi:ATP-dependent DNA helicase DinG